VSTAVVCLSASAEPSPFSLLAAASASCSSFISSADLISESESFCESRFKEGEKRIGK